MNELLEKIRSRGYWKVIIRPGTFTEKRVPNIADLYPILESRAVQLLGWSFPYLDSKSQLKYGPDWIEQESPGGGYPEFWRFYQSGQFVDFSGMPDDWLDQSPLRPAPGDWKPGKFLGLGDTLLRFVEAFEFASRLAFTEAGDQQMHIEVIVNGLEGRTLQPDIPGPTTYLRRKMASITKFPYKIDVSFIELVTEPRELALKPAVELFQRFGWNPSLEILRDMQDELLHRRSGVVGR